MTASSSSPSRRRRCVAHMSGNMPKHTSNWEDTGPGASHHSAVCKPSSALLSVCMPFSCILRCHSRKGDTPGSSLSQNLHVQHSECDSRAGTCLEHITMHSGGMHEAWVHTGMLEGAGAGGCCLVLCVRHMRIALRACVHEVCVLRHIWHGGMQWWAP